MIFFIPVAIQVGLHAFLQRHPAHGKYLFEVIEHQLEKSIFEPDTLDLGQCDETYALYRKSDLFQQMKKLIMEARYTTPSSEIRTAFQLFLFLLVQLRSVRPEINADVTIKYQDYLGEIPVLLGRLINDNKDNLEYLSQLMPPKTPIKRPLSKDQTSLYNHINSNEAFISIYTQFALCEMILSNYVSTYADADTATSIRTSLLFADENRLSQALLDEFIFICNKVIHTSKNIKPQEVHDFIPNVKTTFEDSQRYELTSRQLRFVDYSFHEFAFIDMHNVCKLIISARQRSLSIVHCFLGSLLDHANFKYLCRTVKNENFTSFIFSNNDLVGMTNEDYEEICNVLRNPKLRYLDFSNNKLATLPGDNNKSLCTAIRSSNIVDLVWSIDNGLGAFGIECLANPNLKSLTLVGDLYYLIQFLAHINHTKIESLNLSLCDIPKQRHWWLPEFFDVVANSPVRHINLSYNHLFSVIQPYSEWKAQQVSQRYGSANSSSDSDSSDEDDDDARHYSSGRDSIPYLDFKRMCQSIGNSQLISVSLYDYTDCPYPEVFAAAIHDNISLTEIKGVEHEGITTRLEHNRVLVTICSKLELFTQNLQVILNENIDKEIEALSNEALAVFERWQKLPANIGNKKGIKRLQNKIFDFISKLFSMHKLRIDALLMLLDQNNSNVILLRTHYLNYAIHSAELKSANKAQAAQTAILAALPYCLSSDKELIALPAMDQIVIDTYLQTSVGQEVLGAKPSALSNQLRLQYLQSIILQKMNYPNHAWGNRCTEINSMLSSTNEEDTHIIQAIIYAQKLEIRIKDENEFARIFSAVTDKNAAKEFLLKFPIFLDAQGELLYLSEQHTETVTKFIIRAAGIKSESVELSAEYRLALLQYVMLNHWLDQKQTRASIAFFQNDDSDLNADSDSESESDSYSERSKNFVTTLKSLTDLNEDTLRQLDKCWQARVSHLRQPKSDYSTTAGVWKIIKHCRLLGSEVNDVKRSVKAPTGATNSSASTFSK